MGASSSGLLDEAKIGHVKGLVDRTFQSFSVFYRQQYSAAYCGHLHQEVEPKKEGRGLLLTRGPQFGPEEVLYQGCVKCSCWDEQGKKSKERYIILRRDYKVEIYENKESFSRGCAAKLVLKTAGGSVFTTEVESRAHLEQTCAGILNEAKEDSSSVVSSPDTLAVYLHLPYTGHTCFLFQQEEKQDHFLSALKTCIRHCNLDPWCDSSYENQAYIQAFRLYRQDKGCYESWELLLGTEEKALASQVMEEVLPWLQSQLQSKVKGKKTERIRQWLATLHATYTLVLEQLTASLEALREECRKTASANQALIRSDLDQIMSSHHFLEEKVRACICEEAEKVCSESVAPYMSSILEALTENISAGIQGMRHTLQTQMDAAFTNGGTGDTKKALSTLRATSLDQCYRQVENLTEKLAGLKQRFGLSSVQRLVHSAHLEMETLSESAVYTLELFLQSSNRLQPSQIPVKMDRAKERVLKQLDYDSRVVQKRLYQEALLEITLPALTRRTDNKWKAELQQFEQYIFSDYSSFILVHNIYDDVLRSILSKEIETALQDATSKKTNNLLLDTSDLAISQYSLIGQTPPRSAPDSPSIQARDSSSAAPSEEAAPVVEETVQTVTAEVCLQVDPEPNADAKPDPSPSQSSDQITVLPSPVIVVIQQFDELSTEEASCFEETQEEVQVGTDAPSATADSSNPTTPDVPANPESTDPIPDSDLSMSTSSSPPSTDVLSECAQSDQPPTPEVSETPDLSTSDPVPEDSPAPCTSSSHPPSTDSPMKISLGSLSKAIGSNSTVPFVMQTMAQRSMDRAVYLTGEIKDNWEMQRVKEDKQKEAEEEKEVHKTEAEKEEKEEEKEVDERETETEEGREKEKEAHARETEKEAKQEEKQKEAGEEKEVDKTEAEKEAKEEEKEVDESETETEEGKEEEKQGERVEGEMEGVAQTEGESVDKGCRSSESPAESTTVSTTEQRAHEEKVDDEGKGSEVGTEERKEDEEGAEGRGDHAEQEGKKEEEEEVLPSPQPMESGPENGAELPLDSVAIIRALVTEISEVETIIRPCPNMLP
ncbi:Protein Niban [Larimichthys crocea]|uniref:Protein Niban n=1 Tax=Larimichthys crocea TaxID=215358 RepID=A0A0F8AM49_LARCR|nr:Protein Niban [Larimichthys crocea]